METHGSKKGDDHGDTRCEWYLPHSEGGKECMFMEECEECIKMKFKLRQRVVRRMRAKRLKRKKWIREERKILTK